MMVALLLSSIHRVVSCFILKGAADVARQDLRIAVFHRVATMPTFPGHWAACSGSIEPGETPWETCRRELMEETNLNSALAQPNRQSGLYVDVPLASNKNENNNKVHHNENQHVPQRTQRTIRVYPFTVEIPVSWDLQLRGTEHDRFEWITVDQLELLEPAVPCFAAAFHHATSCRYLTSVTPSEREWASDHVSGASAMARRAVELLLSSESSDAENHHEQADPSRMIMMRPSMVAITNALQPIIQGKMQAQHVLESLDTCQEQSINYAVSNILSLCRDLRRQQQQERRPLRIATHSRSSRLLAILQRVLMVRDEDEIDEIDDTDSNNDKIPLIIRPIFCGESTPGNEGELLARDLNNSVSLFGSVRSATGTTIPVATCVDDATLYDMIAMRNSGVDLLLVGADCIYQDAIINKVGTKRLAEAAANAAVAMAIASTGSSRCHVVCCADRFKLWDDIFPPPLEDIFESVPMVLPDLVLVPPPPPAMERGKRSSQL
jgi:8-oxo-dGTP pyrophosphatase MutT (NUDIX family)/translation initiation factor 2B subunit (eIF-2B alpha/beta/delta family)